MGRSTKVLKRVVWMYSGATYRDEKYGITADCRIRLAAIPVDFDTCRPALHTNRLGMLSEYTGSMAKCCNKCIGFPLMESVRGRRGTKVVSFRCWYNVAKAARQSGMVTAPGGISGVVSDWSTRAADSTSLLGSGFPRPPLEGELLKSEENGSVCCKCVAVNI